MEMALLAFGLFSDAGTVEFSLRGFHYLRVVLAILFFYSAVTPSLSKLSSLKSKSPLKSALVPGPARCQVERHWGWTPGLGAGDNKDDLKGSHPVRQGSVVKTRCHKGRRGA